MSEELAEKEALFQSGLFNRLGQAIVRAVLPARCLACGEAVHDAAAVCVTCWQKLRLLEEPLCDVMGTAFAYDQGPGALSPQALSHPPAWDRSRAAMIFDEHSKGFVHALKYGDRTESGRFMARMMLQAGRGLIAEADVIVPVPLHWTRLWQRRFNQAAYLAQRLAEASGKPFMPQLLKRARRTAQQVGLDAEARRKNMRKAFRLDDPVGKLKGRKVLLVDDVRTTGATITACVEALKAGGVGQVFVLTFALVDGPFRPHIERQDETYPNLYN